MSNDDVIGAAITIAIAGTIFAGGWAIGNSVGNRGVISPTFSVTIADGKRKYIVNGLSVTPEQAERIAKQWVEFSETVKEPPK